ncbi:MAG: YciI family protein [Paracoccaceae bacterium]
MRYVLICADKPGALQTRLDNRAAHLAYIEASGIVEQAGPVLDDDGAMRGSVVILTADSLGAAQDWAANDPYNQAGLFESVSIQAWNRVIG